MYLVRRIVEVSLDMAWSVEPLRLEKDEIPTLSCSLDFVLLHSLRDE